MVCETLGVARFNITERMKSGATVLLETIGHEPLAFVRSKEMSPLLQSLVNDGIITVYHQIPTEPVKFMGQLHLLAAQRIRAVRRTTDLLKVDYGGELGKKAGYRGRSTTKRCAMYFSTLGYSGGT
ncbi:hypothetical protein J2X76_004914 [Neorhizobium sp. 2083]|nr:hypothetical protein [Neorhizobium sp. 2083]